MKFFHFFLKIEKIRIFFEIFCFFLKIEKIRKNLVFFNFFFFFNFYLKRIEDGNFIDVRYYVTGLEAVRLDALATDHRRQLESVLGAVIVMNGIDPCLDELKSPCSAGCTNQMKISTVPYHSFSRSASFVGVKARVLAQCSCPYQAVIDPAPAPAGEGSASWAVPPGGLCTQDASGRCPFGFQAPRCDPTRHVPFSGFK